MAEGQQSVPVAIQWIGAGCAALAAIASTAFGSIALWRSRPKVHLHVETANVDNPRDEDTDPDEPDSTTPGIQVIVTNGGSQFVTILRCRLSYHFAATPTKRQEVEREFKKNGKIGQGETCRLNIEIGPHKVMFTDVRVVDSTGKAYSAPSGSLREFERRHNSHRLL